MFCTQYLLPTDLCYVVPSNLITQIRSLLCVNSTITNRPMLCCTSIITISPLLCCYPIYLPIRHGYVGPVSITNQIPWFMLYQYLFTNQTTVMLYQDLYTNQILYVTQYLFTIRPLFMLYPVSITNQTSVRLVGYPVYIYQSDPCYVVPSIDPTDPCYLYPVSIPIDLRYVVPSIITNQTSVIVPRSIPSDLVMWYPVSITTSDPPSSITNQTSVIVVPVIYYQSDLCMLVPVSLTIRPLFMLYPQYLYQSDLLLCCNPVSITNQIPVMLYTQYYTNRPRYVVTSTITNQHLFCDVLEPVYITQSDPCYVCTQYLLPIQTPVMFVPVSLYQSDPCYVVTVSIPIRPLLLYPVSLP
ncbi:unnamed protein product [Coregonus sp. 'balchen']|nr:unnamed protein product [Coregonus sp. 'balchen']